jgi:hypothetical protein
MRKLTILFIILTATGAVFAQGTQKTADPQSDAKKAFEKLKTASGSWQGSIMGITINFTIRPASSGTAILHEGMTEGGGPPNHEITMIYLDGDRLLATHYCDAGNRSNLEGKLSPDGKSVEFGFLELNGSSKGGYLKGLVMNLADADRQVVELIFVQPDGKPIPLRGEFKRTK